MKNTHFVFLFATLLFAGSGCGDSAPATTAPSEKASASQQAQNPTPTAQIAQRMPRYTHTKYGFSIEPPLNWKVDESKPGLALMISSDHADEASAKFNYRANINVQVTQLTNGSVAETAKKFVSSFGSSWNSVKVLEEGPAKVGDAEAYKVVVDLAGDDYSPRGECFVVRADAIDGAVVCGYALDSKWAENKDILESSLATFKP